MAFLGERPSFLRRSGAEAPAVEAHRSQGQETQPTTTPAVEVFDAKAVKADALLNLAARGDAAQRLSVGLGRL